MFGGHDLKIRKGVALVADVFSKQRICRGRDGDGYFEETGGVIDWHLMVYVF